MQFVTQSRQVVTSPTKSSQDDVKNLQARLDAALSAMKQLQEQEKQYRAKITHLEDENQSLAHELEQVVELTDLEARACRNKSITPLDFRLFKSLIDTYPEVLTGGRVGFNPFKVRQNAGGAHRNSAGAFFQALHTAGIVHYEPGNYLPDEKDEDERRVCFITANLSLFMFPETWKLKEDAKRAAARKKDTERKQEQRRAWLILKCVECGSDDITYAVRPTCNKCGHKHEIITGLTNEDMQGAQIDPFFDMMPEDLTQEPEPEPVKRAPVAFTDVQPGKWASNCRNHKMHQDQWKIDIAGLTCPVCARRAGR